MLHTKVKNVILVLLLCSAFAAGQSIMTTVTGTVVDPVGTPYSGGRYNLDLVNNTGVVAANVRIGTSSVYPTTISGVLTSTGAFPAAGVPLYDNGQISPAGTQWRFSICNSGGTICFTTNLTITGASQNVGSALSAASVLLNTGSGGSVVTGPLGQLLDLSTANDGVTGTTALGLAIRSGSTAICATTADTATPAYPVSNAVTVNGTTVAQAGTTGNAPLILQGRASVTFDANGVTKGDYVGVSTVSGCKAMSLGVSYPAGRCWVGVALETVVGSAAGVIAVNNSCSLAPSGYSVAQSAGVTQPARTKLNFIGGLTAADNAGNTSTDVSLTTLPFATGSAASPSLYATSFPNGFGIYGSAVAFMGEYNHADVFRMGLGGIEFVGGVGCIDWNNGTYGAGSSKINSDGAGNFYFGADGNCGTVSTGIIKAAAYKTDTDCASSASPAVCGSAAAGSVALPAGGTTLTVNTTRVGPLSEIFLTRDDTLGTKLGVTCNTQSSLTLGTPRVTTRTGSTSFVVSVDVGPTTNPLCMNYYITGN